MNPKYLATTGKSEIAMYLHNTSHQAMISDKLLHCRALANTEQF